MSGSFLRWSPEKGYIYIQYFDNEHPCSFSYGKVSVKGFEVTFIPEYEKNEICPPPPYLHKSAPLKWISALGGKYFIPADEAERFGNFYGGFGEFNKLYWDWYDSHPFARRWGDKIEEENFILPKPYSKFIKKPINADITFVGQKIIRKNNEESETQFQTALFNDYYSETPVKINAGKNLGIIKDLEFIIASGESDSQTLKITKVGKTSSEGVVIRRINENMQESYLYYDKEKQDSFEKEFNPLKIGQKVTTSIFVAEELLKQD